MLFAPALAHPASTATMPSQDMRRIRSSGSSTGRRGKARATLESVFERREGIPARREGIPRPP
jgi:hypothetical protein